MENLAGDKQSTEKCRHELTRCGIEIVDEAEPIGEPKAFVSGRLGALVFYRAWYYWAVNGDVPLDVARELYADPVGVSDIRVAGHCGCPAPEEPWIKWRMSDGREVLSLKEKADAELYAGSDGSLAKVAKEILDTHLFSDDPASIGAQAYISSYHIDSEIGLRLFADTIKKHGLDCTSDGISA